MRIEQALSQWANSLRWAGKAETTQTTYAHAGRQMRDWLKEQGVLELAEVTPDLMRQFLFWMTETRSPSTARQRRSSLSVFFNFCVEEGFIDVSPLARVKAPKVPHKDIPIVSERDFKLLVDSCDDSFVGARDRAILMLMLDTGLRVSEVVSLKTADFDWETDTIGVWGKGAKWRAVPFTYETGRILNHYNRRRRQHRHAANPHFLLGERGALTRSGIQSMLRRKAAGLGIPHVHPHMLRHSAADRLMSKGVSDGSIMELMGWSTGSRAMLDRYASVRRQSRAFDEYRRIFP